MKILINHDNENLYCIYCKSLINIGEKYAIILEEYNKEIISKSYHLECIPEDDEELWIGEENK